MCSTCGSTAMHRQCLPQGQQRFHCADCTIALEEGDSGRESLNAQQDEEDEDVDVCHVSDKEDFDIVNRLFAGVTGNKRDSGSHDHQTDNSDNEDDDDDRPRPSRYAKRNRKITDSSSISSEENNESKGCKLINTRRLRTDSANSNSKMSSEDDYIPKPRSCSSLSRRITESSEDELDFESETEEECIKPSNVKETRRLKPDSECSTTSSCSSNEIIPSSQRNPRRLKTDSESSASSSSSNSQVRTTNTRKISTTTITNSEEDETEEKTNNKEKRRSSSEEEIIKLPFKRKPSKDLFHSEDEADDEEIPLKLKKVDNEEKNDSMTSEESEEDDDPLENFSKIVEKQKNISCIALRTRNSISNKTPNLPTNAAGVSPVNTERENKENHRNSSTNTKRPSKFVPLKDESSKTNNLDISCIAKRTRRKSMYVEDGNSQQNQEALQIKRGRGRRKTICAESNYLQKSLYEMSQIYEKVHESDEERASTIDEESEPESDEESEVNEVLVDTDLDNFIVDDGYEEKDSKFEISCIANRTRKRQSLKRLSTFEEEEDSCSSTASSYASNSSNSSNSTTSSLSSHSSNKTERKRCSRRLSSDEFEIPQKSHITSARSQQTKTISSSLLLDKLPQHNFTAFLKPKTITKVSTTKTSQNSYHPSANHYRPHCNNRKRF